MSTPITHNAIFTLSTIDVVEVLPKRRHTATETVLGIVKECVALYNYPDAVQAIRRLDGTILSRRVTHFESSKTFGEEPNWHNLFSPEFLQTVTEGQTVTELIDFHDTADQEGDIVGQYTDWYAWQVCKNAYVHWASKAEDHRAIVLAEMVESHLSAADSLNDQLFRKYISQLSDGSIMIGTAKFSEEEKREAFTLFKNLLMKLQENASMKLLAQSFNGTSHLNEAIEASYRLTFSPWLAANSLKFVKPIHLDGLEGPTDAELAILAKAKIDLKKLEEEAMLFIQQAVLLTSPYIWGVNKLLKSIK